MKKAFVILLTLLTCPSVTFSQCLPTFATTSELSFDQYTSPSGAYIWYSSGIYTDTILNSLGCDSIITVDLTIEVSPIVSFMGDILTGCTPLDVTFNSSSSCESGCNTYTWNFNDGTTISNNGGNITHTFTSDSIWDVTLEVVSNSVCNTTITYDDYIYTESASLNLADTISTCDPYESIDAGPGFSSYLWSKGETSQSISVNNSGTYSVDVASELGCQDSCSVYVYYDCLEVIKT